MKNHTLKQRFKALFLDYLIILLWMAVLAAVNVILFIVIFDGFPDYLGMFGPFWTQLIFFGVLTLPVGLFLYCSEAGPRHATFGKRKAHLKVVSTDGSWATRKQTAVRTVVKLLPWELSHAFIWQMQYVFYEHGYEAAVPAWIFVGLNVATLMALVYVMLVVVRKDRRSVHDLVAGTKVVSSNK
ncbi:MAG TPA: RDD family protein [Candidatus Saccharimonadales bacterium]|nr:RDD family protein [Candidatus Saccharimonadales bacterium]